MPIMPSWRPSKGVKKAVLWLEGSTFTLVETAAIAIRIVISVSLQRGKKKKLLSKTGMGSPWFFLICLSKYRKMQLLHLHWEPQHCWRTMMDWIKSWQNSSVKRLTASISECQCVWKWGHYWWNQLKGADPGVRWGSNSIRLVSLQKK